MVAPTVVFIGFIGKLPVAGMALANVHAIVGLQQLGYRVHYVERQNRPLECYDPRTDEMTDDPSAALAYLAQLLPRYGLGPTDFSFIDTENRCHGSGWPELRRVLMQADCVIDMGTGSWFDELERCPRRAFVDVDPMFTQIEMLEATSLKAQAVRQFDTVFTEGLRVGHPDCLVPEAGRHWHPSRPAVVTGFWTADTAGRGQPLTTLMNWASGKELVHEGRVFGYKNREFERFMDLPARTAWTCRIAVGGLAPRDRLGEFGWQVESALDATRTIEAYQHFIARSAVDFGVAKHAYVESRCGWFSDRSTCYLAAGRPVLHQDTCLREYLPTGEGLLLFSTMEEAVEGLTSIARDYDRHARAARAIAQEYFEASTVMRRMLNDAGWL